MYVRKRKSFSNAADGVRSGGKGSRFGSSEVKQRGFKNQHAAGTHSFNNQSNWAPQSTQVKPPPFKSLLENTTRKDLYSDRRNANYSLSRGYPARNEDNYNNSRTQNNYNNNRAQANYNTSRPAGNYDNSWSQSNYDNSRPQNSYNSRPPDGYNNSRPQDNYNSTRGSYGDRHDRPDPYDQRNLESHGRGEGSGFQQTIGNVMLGSDFKYGNTPFANIQRSADEYGDGGRNRGDDNMSRVNYGGNPYPGRRDDPYSDRRDDPYSSDRRGSYDDKRRDASLDRRHSYPDRRDSFTDRSHGSYPDRRGGEYSPERGSLGHYPDRRESESYQDKRYDSHSSRVGDQSYGDRGHASYRDKREDDSYNDKRSFYHPERSINPYPEGRGGSPYRRGSDSIMDYERSPNRSYNDQNRGSNTRFASRERLGDSYHVDQQRRIESSHPSLPRERNYSPLGVGVVREQKTSIKVSMGGSRATSGRSFLEKIKGNRESDDSRSPSKFEKEAAMGIFKKVLDKQQRGRGSAGNRSVPSRKDHVVNVTKLPKKRRLEVSVSQQNKKPRISVLSRLGPKLEKPKLKIAPKLVKPKKTQKQNKKILSRLGPEPKSGDVKSRLGPGPKSGGVKSRLGQRSVPEDQDEGVPLRALNLTPTMCSKLAKRNQDLPLQCLRCSKCKRDEFPSVASFLRHQTVAAHLRVDTSFHKKIIALCKYLQSEAQLSYARQIRSQVPKNAEFCAVCGVPKLYNRNHLDNKVCEVVHKFCKPANCCGRTSFRDRSSFEDHCVTIPHLKNKSQQHMKNLKRYELEKKVVEEAKMAYLSGKEPSNKDGNPLKVYFSRHHLFRERDIYKWFGTVQTPAEVSSLLQTIDELSEPPVIGKILIEMKKLKNDYYDPSNMHGQRHILFQTNFNCDLCGIVLGTSQQSIIDHCSTKEHYDNFVKELQKHKEKPLKIEPKEDKDDTINEEYLTGNASAQNEDADCDFNDIEVFGDHHNTPRNRGGKRSMEVKAPELENIEIKKEAKDVEKFEVMKNKPVVVMTKKSEPIKKEGTMKTKEAEDVKELGEEKTKQEEEEDVDIYSDPYGGSELLGCGDEDNTREDAAGEDENVKGDDACKVEIVQEKKEAYGNENVPEDDEACKDENLQEEDEACEDENVHMEDEACGDENVHVEDEACGDENKQEEDEACEENVHMEDEACEDENVHMEDEACGDEDVQEEDEACEDEDVQEEEEACEDEDVQEEEEAREDGNVQEEDEACGDENIEEVDEEYEDENVEEVDEPCEEENDQEEDEAYEDENSQEEEACEEGNTLEGDEMGEDEDVQEEDEAYEEEDDDAHEDEASEDDDELEEDEACED